MNRCPGERREHGRIDDPEPVNTSNTSVGADNTAVEISPNPDRDLAGPVHQIMLVVNGIHLLENLRLDELAARRVHEFALIVEPLKIQGGTGSTVAPIAVR